MKWNNVILIKPLPNKTKKKRNRTKLTKFVAFSQKVTLQLLENEKNEETVVFEILFGQFVLVRMTNLSKC
jgi:hypothetical protein